MFSFLLSRIVLRNPISTSPITKTHERFIKYSSTTQIHENRIIKRPSSRKEADYITPVTKLLKSYDFTDPQIVKIFTKFPINPSCNRTNVIKPKLDFFLGHGFSSSQLAKFISTYPGILESSLETRLKPTILQLKSFFETENHLVQALSYNHALAQSKLETNFFPNVTTLTNHGVPRSKIMNLAIIHSRTLLTPAKKFEKLVQIVISKGFDPSSASFCTGLSVIAETSPLTWNKKVSLYKSLGWSEEAVASAFVRQPCCMLASEKQIKQIMDFFVNKMQCEPLYVVRRPVIINLSFKKRMVPRSRVLDILVKKQLVKKSSANQYLINNKDFLAKYVMSYQDQVPEVLHAYNGNLEIASPENVSPISLFEHMLTTID